MEAKRVPLRLKLNLVGRISEPLGELYIVNDRTGNEIDGGNYVAVISDKAGRTRTIRVDGHQRAHGAWVLVAECLNKLIAQESLQIEELVGQAKQVMKEEV
jgi:hypothetical protein